MVFTNFRFFSIVKTLGTMRGSLLLTMGTFHFAPLTPENTGDEWQSFVGKVIFVFEEAG